MNNESRIKITTTPKTTKLEEEEEEEEKVEITIFVERTAKILLPN
jgi:hypothetical protein